MTDTADKLDRVRAALASEPRVYEGEGRIELALEGEVLTMTGEVADVAAKKLALERAAALSFVVEIVDRLHVRPAERMADGAIRDLLRDALVGEPAFSILSIRRWAKGAPEVLQSPDGAFGWIDLRVEDGVVTLDGEVPGNDYKRLAGVLAWWVPGSRDVINGLGVTPPEEDSDEAIAEALRLVLEKDPFVDAGQIRAAVQDAVVTLTGLVPSESERRMAEADAWYLFGVDAVDNRIEVRA